MWPTYSLISHPGTACYVFVYHHSGFQLFAYPSSLHSAAPQLLPQAIPIRLLDDFNQPLRKNILRVVDAPGGVLLLDDENTVWYAQIFDPLSNPKLPQALQMQVQVLKLYSDVLDMITLNGSLWLIKNDYQIYLEQATAAKSMELKNISRFISSSSFNLYSNLSHSPEENIRILTIKQREVENKVVLLLGTSNKRLLLIRLNPTGRERAERDGVTIDTTESGARIEAAQAIFNETHPLIRLSDRSLYEVHENMHSRKISLKTILPENTVGYAFFVKDTLHIINKKRLLASEGSGAFRDEAQVDYSKDLQGEIVDHIVAINSPMPMTQEIYFITEKGILLKLIIHITAAHKKYEFFELENLAIKGSINFLQPGQIQAFFWQQLMQLAPDEWQGIKALYTNFLIGNDVLEGISSKLQYLNNRPDMGNFVEIKAPPPCLCLVISLLNFMFLIVTNHEAAENALQNVVNAEYEFCRTARQATPLAGGFSETLQQRYFPNKKQAPLFFWTTLKSLLQAEQYMQLSAVYSDCIANSLEPRYDCQTVLRSLTLPSVLNKDQQYCLQVAVALLRLIALLRDRKSDVVNRQSCWQILNDNELQAHGIEGIEPISGGFAAQLKKRVYPQLMRHA